MDWDVTFPINSDCVHEDIYNRAMDAIEKARAKYGALNGVEDEKSLSICSEATSIPRNRGISASFPVFRRLKIPLSDQRISLSFNVLHLEALANVPRLALLITAPRF